jgi:DNA-binding GntR family transcriptional regulator
MNATEAEKTGNLNASAYEVIRSMILNGSLAPGARIVESDLADHIGVSRTPVRSALHRLQQDGYVLDQERGRKVKLIVAPLTKEDAREIYHIVGALDGLAAWHAARLPEAEREVLAAEMTDINHTLAVLEQSPQGAFQRLLALHGEFHALPLRAIEAPRLKSLHATTKPQADRYRSIYSSGDYGQQKLSLQEHGGIVEALRAGDPAEALRRTQDHWMMAADRLSGIIDVLGERGSWGPTT